MATNKELYGENINERLKILVQKKKDEGMRLDEVATKIGISKSSLSNYMSTNENVKNTTMKIDVLKNMAEFFNVPSDFLLCLTDDPMFYDKDITQISKQIGLSCSTVKKLFSNKSWSKIFKKSNTVTSKYTIGELKPQILNCFILDALDEFADTLHHLFINVIKYSSYDKLKYNVKQAMKEYESLLKTIESEDSLETATALYGDAISYENQFRDINSKVEASIYSMQQTFVTFIKNIIEEYIHINEVKECIYNLCQQTDEIAAKLSSQRYEI